MNTTPEDRQWLEKAGKEAFEKIGSSAFFLSLFTPNFRDDALCALQLGYAILMEKPLCFIVENGTPMPPVLERLASKIVHYEKGNKADYERAVTELTDAVESGALP